MRLADLHAQCVLARREIDGVRLTCLVRQRQRGIVRTVRKQEIFKFRKGNHAVNVDFPSDAQLTQAVLLIARGNAVKAVLFDGEMPFDPLSLLGIRAAADDVQCDGIRIVRADGGRRTVVGRNDGRIGLGSDQLGLERDRLGLRSTLRIFDGGKIAFIALRLLGDQADIADLHGLTGQLEI